MKIILDEEPFVKGLEVLLFHWLFSVIDIL